MWMHWVWVCWIVSLLSLPGGRVSADTENTPRVAVTPLEGAGGARCSRVLAEEARRLRIDVGEWLGPPLPATGPFKSLVDLLTLVPFDIVVYGRVKDDHLILEAYRTRPIKLLGLVAIRTPGRCKLDVQGNQLFAQWWAETVVPRNLDSEPFALPQLSAVETAISGSQSSTRSQFVEIGGT